MKTIRFVLVFFAALAALPLFTAFAGAADFEVGSSGDGVGLSAALMPGDELGLSYFQEGSAHLVFRSAAKDADLVDSSLAQIPTVATSGLTFASRTALVVLAGEPHIVYYHPGVQELRHAYRSGGAWKVEAITALPSGGAPAAAVQASDIFVSYYHHAAGALYYARHSSAGWTHELVDSSSGDVGGMSAICVQSNGLPAIAYFDGANRQLKAAFKTSGGSWSITTLSYPSEHLGLYPGIACRSDGSVYVSASSYKPESEPFDLAVQVMKRDPSGTWSLAYFSRDYAGGPTAILAAAGVDLASRYLRKSVVYGDSAAVQYGVLDPSGLWVTEMLGAELGATTISDVQLVHTSAGDPIVVVRYARDGSSGIHVYEPPLPPPPLPAAPAPVVSGPSGSSGSSSSGSSGSSSSTSAGKTTSENPKPPSTRVAASYTATSRNRAFLLKAGGSAVSDSLGRVWQADAYFRGGQSGGLSVALPATTDASLYRHERVGRFHYNIPVAPGRYRVILRFAPISTHPNRNVFDVFAQGQQVLSNFDGAAKGVKPRVFRLALTANAPGGVLSLNFRPVKGAAALATVEIEPVGMKVLRINAGGAAARDSFGRLWKDDIYYSGGRSAAVSTPPTLTPREAAAHKIASEVYRTERRGGSFSYRIPLANGRYQVVLSFSESAHSAAAENVFSVVVQDSTSFNNLNILRDAGARTPLLLPAEAVVTNGELSIVFQAASGIARVSAIEITRTGGI